MLDRHLGPKAMVGVVVFALALAWGITQLLPERTRELERPRPTAVATPCVKAAQPWGTAPDGFAYENVSEATRAKTVKALKLDEASGRVEMVAARRDGRTLGTLVGVPSKDPAAYASELVGTAERGGAPVSKRPHYSVFPLGDGSVVAVGARGCRAILISAQDAKAVPFLADAVFSG